MLFVPVFSCTRKEGCCFYGFVSCMLRAPLGVLLLSHTSCNTEKASWRIKERDKEGLVLEISQLERERGLWLCYHFQGSTAILGEHSHKERDRDCTFRPHQEVSLITLP